MLIQEKIIIGNDCRMNAYCVKSSVLSVLQPLTHSVLTTTLYDVGTTNIPILLRKVRQLVRSQDGIQNQAQETYFQSLCFTTS